MLLGFYTIRVIGIPDARVHQLCPTEDDSTTVLLLGLATLCSCFIPWFADYTSTLTKHVTNKSPRLVNLTTDMTDSF